MDEHTDGFVCVEECSIGDLRVRLSRHATRNGESDYMVHVVAWNAWAEQGKLLAVVGGIDMEAAQELFAGLKKDLRGYDWVTGECILADKE